MSPLVSVVIPAYNAIDHIDDCLTSVFRQRASFSLEVIVVNDGSTDGTLQKLRHTSGISCLTQSNLGPAAARNAGIKQAQGDFIAFLDADDLWPEGKIQNQIDLLQRYPGAAMCFGDCRQFNNEHPWPHTLFEESGYGEDAWGPGPYLPNAYFRLLGDNFITTGSVVVRRKILDELGGFDAHLRLVEDLDLWLRIARHYPIIWHKDVCLLRRRHSGNASREQDAMSLAYLEALKRQQACCRDELDRQGINLKYLFAREYQIMADRALIDRRPEDAARWAWLGFITRPGLRPLWRMVQAAGQQLARKPGR